MRKFLSIIMSILLIATCTACGRYEKLEPSKALHASPELNVKDEYYTTALTEGPIVLTDWVQLGTRNRIKKGTLNKVLTIENQNYRIIKENFGVDISLEALLSGYNAEDYEKLLAEDYEISESMENRCNWETKNQFDFASRAICYLNLVEDWNTYTLNGLNVTYAYYIDEDSYQLDQVREQGGSPYVETEKTDADPYRQRYAQWTDKEAYDAACANLETEHAKLKDTVIKYLDQKYNGVDNGIQFSDYMLKHSGIDYDAVESFIKAQKFGTVEIKDVNAYSNFITFHPFVDIEYTLVIDGTEHYMHEIYFMEIDEYTEGNFDYKIAYVADYNGMFDYTLFRSGEFNVGEAFDYDPLKKECVTDYTTKGLGEFYFTNYVSEFQKRNQK